MYTVNRLSKNGDGVGRMCRGTCGGNASLIFLQHPGRVLILEDPRWRLTCRDVEPGVVFTGRHCFKQML